MKVWCGICRQAIEQKDYRLHRQRHRDQRRTPRQRWKRGRTWMALRQRAIDALGPVCWNCGRRTDALELHHILPRSEGGQDVLENVRLMCRPCHRARHRGVA